MTSFDHLARNGSTHHLSQHPSDPGTTIVAQKTRPEMRKRLRTPHIILQEQSKYPYVHIADRVPDKDFMADYRGEWDNRVNLDWLGIVSAVGMSDNSERRPV